jgi:hypothetical protein
MNWKRKRSRFFPVCVEAPRRKDVWGSGGVAPRILNGGY